MHRAIQVTECHYPESDGKPMGETDMHRDEMVRHVEILRRYYADQQVYVSGDLLVYYEQGNPKKFVVPDAFVAKGVPPGKRRIYKIWQEGQVPNVVIETTSKKTRKKDTTVKPELYRMLKINEYFLFDPEGDYLDPVLQGYRLAGTDYQPIEQKNGNQLKSEQLQLLLSPMNGRLEFIRVSDGKRLLDAEEACELEAEARQQEAKARQQEAKARQQEAEARQQEAKARQAAEAEVLRLREELARLRGT